MKDAIRHDPPDRPDEIDELIESAYRPDPTPQWKGAFTAAKRPRRDLRDEGTLGAGAWGLLLDALISEAHGRSPAAYHPPYRRVEPWPIAQLPEGGPRAAGPEHRAILAPAPTLSAARPSLEAVVKELNKAGWDFRTVEGIADALGTTPTAVQHVLDSYPEVYRLLPARDEKGRLLIVSNRHGQSWKERLLRIRTYLAKSR